MNLQEIQHVLNNSFFTDELKEEKILEVIAEDKNAIPIIMRMLAFERAENQQLINEMNVCLSKTCVGLEEPQLNREGFMQKEIMKFYSKFSHRVKQLFTKN